MKAIWIQAETENVTVHSTAPDSSRTLPESAFAPVRRLLKIYSFALIIVWLVGIEGAYARAHWMRFSPWTEAIWFHDGTVSHTDMTGFNRQADRFISSNTGYPVVVYPPFLMTVYMALYRLSDSPTALFSTIGIIGALGIAAFLGFVLSAAFPKHRAALFCVALASVVSFYPFWFDLERSNLELFVWFAVTAAVIALVTRHYKMAAICIALAASMKLYPGVLLLAFLKERRFKELILAISAAVLFTVLGLWSLNTNLSTALRETFAGLAQLNKTHISGLILNGIGWDHSLFSPVRQVIWQVNRDLILTDFSLLRAKIAFAAGIYNLVAALAFLMAFVVWIRKLPMLNQLVILTIAAVTLPTMSFEYTLLQVYPALAIFLVYLVYASRQGTPVPFRPMAWALVGFAVIAAPLSFLAGRYVGFGGQVKLVALGVVLISSLQIQMRIGQAGVTNSLLPEEPFGAIPRFAE